MVSEDTVDFVVGTKVGMANWRYGARDCSEACVEGTLHFVIYSRIPNAVVLVDDVIA